MKSRIKANVDHAGLSQPLVLLKVLVKSREEDSTHSQSNNLLIAITLAVKVAKVVQWEELSNTLKLIH